MNTDTQPKNDTSRDTTHMTFDTYHAFITFVTVLCVKNHAEPQKLSMCTRQMINEWWLYLYLVYLGLDLDLYYF